MFHPPAPIQLVSNDGSVELEYSLVDSDQYSSTAKIFNRFPMGITAQQADELLITELRKTRSTISGVTDPLYPLKLQAVRDAGANGLIQNFRQMTRTEAHQWLRYQVFTTPDRSDDEHRFTTLFTYPNFDPFERGIDQLVEPNGLSILPMRVDLYTSGQWTRNLEVGSVVASARFPFDTHGHLAFHEWFMKMSSTEFVDFLKSYVHVINQLELAGTNLDIAKIREGLLRNVDYVSFGVMQEVFACRVSDPRQPAAIDPAKIDFLMQTLFTAPEEFAGTPLDFRDRVAQAPIRSYTDALITRTMEAESNARALLKTRARGPLLNGEASLGSLFV